MSDVKRLVGVRKVLKGKKPRFIRQEFGKFKRIPDKWTRPKGHHSKMRERRKGNPRMVVSGWKSPAAVRALHSSGLARVVVASSSALAQLNKATQGAIIAAAVGTKKRLVLIAEAQKLGITILNLPAAYAEKAQERLTQARQSRAAAAKAKQARKASQEKKTEKKETLDTRTEEEKKKAEKEEKDKLLTQKG